MRATWYVLEDGNAADPNECAPDKAGVLRNKSGVAVAMRGEVPHSRGVDLDPDGKGPSKAAPANPKPAPKAKVANSPANRELKAKGAKKYETR